MSLNNTTKTAVVTGATNGIGKEIAKGLVRDGFHVILVSRDQAKCQRMTKELQNENQAVQVSYRVADLSRPIETQQLAQALAQELPRLDVLVNNAGGYFSERMETPEGFEKTFALNHLGYFVFTQGLLPLLKKSSKARIVNMSSGAHWGGDVDISDLQFSRRAWRAGWPAYSQSKLANILFTVELSRRLAGSDVTVNCMHPGFVATGFGHNNQGWFSSLFVALQKVFARNAVKGAETALFLATSPACQGVSGKYFVDLKPRATSAQARDEKRAAKLWEETERLLEKAASKSAA